MAEVVLITGASSGIGKICAEYLSDKGYIVYGTSRKKVLSKTKYIPLQMDVTDKNSVNAAVDRIINEQKKIDIVINNAGIGVMGALELITEEEIHLQMNTNFFGVVYVCSAVIPHLRREGHGKIINISSIGGVMGLPYQGLYSASKFAVEGYSEALNVELNKFNIKVVLIEPGDFSTGFTANRQMLSVTETHPDYASSYKRALEKIENEENNGGNPIAIAKLIGKILTKKKPAFRYTVGNLEQRFSVLLKRLIPSNWYQSLIRSFYKV